jgi:ABC-type nitrate/sulfonate/bicarbonate transport system substrate-binding protein
MLTACSSGGSSSTSAASSGGDLGTLNVIQSVGQDFSTGAVDFADVWGNWPAGLTVKHSVGSAVAQALATGDVQVGVTSPTRVLAAILQGLDVSIVGSVENQWDQQIVVSNNFKASSINDLQHARWGVSTFGSAGELSVREIAKAKGWADSDYTITTLNDINGLIAGLQNGTIDAFTWGAFAPFQMQEAGQAKLLGFVSDIIGPLPTSVIAVSNQAIQQNPAAIKAFCDTVYKTNQQEIADPTKTAAQFVTWGNSQAASDAAVKAYLPMLATDPSISDQAFQNMIDGTKITSPDAAAYLDLNGIKKYYKNCDDL